MKRDILTEMYLRHYAFLVRFNPNILPNTAYHFSTMVVATIVSFALLAALATALWIASLAVGRSLAPWLFPHWAQLAGAAAIVLLPGIHVDRKMAQLRVVDDQLIDQYSSRHHRFLWTVQIAAILLLTAIAGICFAALYFGLWIY